MKATLLATAIFTIASTASAAHAVTFVPMDGSVATFESSLAGAQYTFESATTGNTGDPTGFTRIGGLVRSGSQTGIASSIFGAPSANNFLYVTQNNTATITALATYQMLSFYIGSIDLGNRVDILGLNGTVLRSFTGTELSSPAIPNGAATSPQTNRLLTFTAEGGEFLTGVTLFSSVNSLEADNIRFMTAVPEPASWAMMMFGFAVIGAAARYRRRRVSVQFS